MARYLSASSSWRRISSRRADESTEISSLGIEIVTAIVTEIVSEIVTETVSEIVSEIVTEIVSEIITEISSLGIKIVATRARLLVNYRVSKTSLFNIWENLANRYCLSFFQSSFASRYLISNYRQGKLASKTSKRF